MEPKKINCRFIKNKPASSSAAEIKGVASCEIQQDMEKNYCFHVVLLIGQNSLLKISYEIEHPSWPDQDDVMDLAEKLAKQHIRLAF